MTTGVLNHKITRRGFLKTSAALGAVAALGDRLFGGPLSTLMVGAQIEGVVSDKWVPSACGLCRLNRDFIRGHVVNGVLVSIEGNPEFAGKQISPSLCCVKPRGHVQLAYNPYRVKAPLKRTNPLKGIDEDPGFVEISWDEALDTLADKLKEMRAKGLINEQGFQRVGASNMGTGGKVSPTWSSFWSVFGPNDSAGAGKNCYWVEHDFAVNWHYNYAQSPDLIYAQWYMGLAKNSVATSAMGMAVDGFKIYADFKVRGGKSIFVDPYMGVTGAKANEWLPIEPLTDGAFLYAMINVILHEMDWRQVADIDFLKKLTVSPYLVTPNGYWARDPATKKPLVWDSVAGAAKVEDDSTIGDFALDGGPYTVNAVERAEPDYANGAETPVTQGTPSFQLMLDHFREFTPEWAAPITDISAKTIRRIAHEYVENSMVGSTIRIDGETFPYRPATIAAGKPLTHCSRQVSWGIGLLAMLMGSLHAPGGMTGIGQNTILAQYNWTKEDREDGFKPSGGSSTSGRSYGGQFVWPPTSRSLSNSVFPKSNGGQLANLLRAGLPIHNITSDPLEVIVSVANNLVTGNCHAGANVLRRLYERLSFYANFNKELNETNWYADLILPDTLWMVEDLAFVSRAPQIGQINHGVVLFNPMIESPVNARHIQDIMTDLAARMGPDFLAAFNRHNGVMGADADPARKYTAEEITERSIRTSTTIPAELRGQYGLDYFKEHGALLWKAVPNKAGLYHVRQVIERTGTRYELPYLEGYKRQHDKRLEELHGVGVFWFDDNLDELRHGLVPYKDFRLVVDEVFEGGPGTEYDLWGAMRRSHQMGFARHKDAPWLWEVYDPFSLGIVMNPETAARKGLADGDWVALESKFGRTTGKLIVSPQVRPDFVAYPDSGQYRVPIAKERGMPSHSELRTVDTRLMTSHGETYIDPVRVKVYKTDKVIPNVPIEKRL